MANTYSRILVHVVFSTKRRQPVLSAEVRARLLPYLGGIAENIGIQLIAANAVEDHVHLLIALKPSMPVSRAVQLLKGNSSHWLHREFGWDEFECWQVGYGAFSIGASQVDRTAEYIRNQETHHKAERFEGEFTHFLQSNGVSFDPQYVFD